MKACPLRLEKALMIKAKEESMFLRQIHVECLGIFLSDRSTDEQNGTNRG